MIVRRILYLIYNSLYFLRQAAKLCKIWVFHGSDYEECSLLGYKNLVRTSQETHYVYVTNSSRLMPCKIRDFHGGDYEELRLLGFYAVWLF
jgi:hypothetical protein